MEKYGSCVLIRYNPEAHEAGGSSLEIRRKVKCVEKSVGMTEAYLAGGKGLVPEKRLLIPYERDYQDETELEYEGRRWTLTRPAAGGEYNGVILAIKPIDRNGRSPETSTAAAPAAEVG